MDYRQLLHGVEALFRDAARRRLLETQRLESARQLAAEGRAAEALAAYQAILATSRTDALAWHELALLQLAMGDAEQAKASLVESIKLDRTRTRAHHDFGRVHAAHPGPPEAERQYLSAIDLPDRADPSLATAEDYARQLLSLKPTCDNYLRLAQVQTASLHEQDAVGTLQAALAAGHEKPAVFEALADLYSIAGRDRDSHVYAGHAHYFKDQYGRAVRNYAAALASSRAAGGVEPVVYARLAFSYSKERNFGEAIAVCRQGITHHPNDELLECVLADLLRADGQTEAARRVATDARQRFPANVRLGRLALMSLPVVYETEGDITRARNAYASGLDTLTRELLVDRVAKSPDALKGLGPTFHLAYQGRDDKALQMAFGRLIHRIACDSYPQWSQPLPMPSSGPGGRIRVGYVSANLYKHTVAKLFLGWLQAHDRNRVEVHAYHVGGRTDPMTHQYERAASCFRHLEGPFESICRQIVEDRLHVLMYLDIGLDEVATHLASLRLAPVQCAAWGHPVTTGLPTIDYFISSEFMEPANGDQHYSEALVRLPGSGVNVPPVLVEEPEKSRNDFGLGSDDCIYLTPQSLLKYLPQYDDIFPRIALRVPRAKFVFIRAGSDNVTEILRRRLLKAFTRHGLDGQAFLVFLPVQGSRDYLDLNRAADIFLDQPGWSGGMTTLEALGCRLPVVTWPGEFMRGRHSAAFLRQMGLEQAIAPDLNSFVDIAARLGSDSAWRHELKQEVAVRKHRLFNDTSCVTALEAFYSSVVTGQLKASEPRL